MFAIGSFARLSGVSVKKLRAYDALGLFRPVWVDPSSAYRYYSPAQLPQLRRLLALRELGIGLTEIKRLLDGGADLANALDRRRAELERDRREMERRLAALDIRVEMAVRGTPALDVVVRNVPEEQVALLDLALVPNRDTGAAFYELEAHIRDLGRRAARPPGALIGEDARAVIFVPLTRPIPPHQRISFGRLPPARMATAIHRGAYGSTRETWEGLERWIHAAGLSPGAPRRVLYLQFGAEPELRVPSPYVVARDEDFVTELQIPVE